MPRETRAQLKEQSDRFCKDWQDTRHDLSLSEEVVEKQMAEIRGLEAKMRGQAHSTTDLRDRNNTLQAKVNELQNLKKVNADTIADLRSDDVTSLHRISELCNQILEGQTAIELGLQLFYPDSFVEPTQAKDPKARLLLRVFDILGQLP